MPVHTRESCPVHFLATFPLRKAGGCEAFVQDWSVFPMPLVPFPYAPFGKPSRMKTPNKPGA